MALPTLTPEQRDENLKKAAEARHARAVLRDRIKSGEVTAAQVLAMDDDAAKRMPVKALIESVPGFGKAKAARIISDLDISEKRRVQGLGARQRERLVAILSA